MRGVRSPGRPAASSGGRSLPDVRPTARGVGVAVALVALLIGVVTLRNAALLPFVVVLGLPLLTAPVLAVERARRGRAADVRIMVAPALVPVGGPCELMVQLANQGDAVLPVLCLDRPPEHSRAQTHPVDGRTSSTTTRRPALLAAGPGRLLRWEAIGAGQCSSVTRTIPTTRRGVFVIGPLLLWAHDPFGLFGVPVATALPATVVVHPRCAPSRVPALVPTGSPTTGSSRPSEIPVQSDDPAGEWSGLRPYVPGDRLHLLSWPAEALYGALLVHEFRPDGQARIRLVLDDRAGVHRRDAFESALSAIHAFLADAGRQGLDVELVALSGDRSVGPALPEGMVEHLTFLARAGPRRGPTRARAGLPDPDAGTASVVVTTVTARPSLPPLRGDPTVVVAE